MRRRVREASIRYTAAYMIALITLCGIIIVLLVACSSTPARASSSASSSADVVTRWEFDHAEIGWSRRHVQGLYGTKGVKVVIWYGEAGHMHIERSYPTADGGTTTAIYRDTLPTPDGTQQGTMRLTRKEWPS